MTRLSLELISVLRLIVEAFLIFSDWNLPLRESMGDAGRGVIIGRAYLVGTKVGSQSVTNRPSCYSIQLY